MSVLQKISVYLGQKDDVPNQELAYELARTENYEGIKEIAENLWNKNKRIQSNCVKVLYEIGYIKPELITDYIEDFLKLMVGKNNRLVWGAMIGLSTIAVLKTDRLYQSLGDIITTIENGSVITIDCGVLILSGIASTKDEYNKKIFPILIDILKNCVPKHVPKYCENISITLNDDNKQEFLSVVELRKKDLTESQLKRLQKVLKKIG